jgi:beta-lactamase superfamily II metal-dependent hydrolase
MFQAGSGDCFLVQIEPDTDNEINLLIDCGYNYRQGIKPKLEDLISKKRKKIDRFIITHYDADHIQGALMLINDNGKADDPKLFPIEQVWLNTFKHLQFSKRENVSNENTIEIVEELKELDRKVNEFDLVGDKSARQAVLLGKQLYENGYSWNIDFDNLAVSPESRENIELYDGLYLQLLTPSYSRLEELENDFIEYLKDKGIHTADDELLDDAFELYCKTINKDNETFLGNKAKASKAINNYSIKYFSKEIEYSPDTSIENGSSISFILHYKGKKILFTGDAFAEDIESALLQAFPQKEDYPIKFDAIKMSHHGSFNNCKPSLFKIIDSNKYLFSTNGKTHNHPDVETISTVINRQTMERRGLYFNHSLKHISEFKNPKLQKEFNYFYKQIESVEI